MVTIALETAVIAALETKFPVEVEPKYVARTRVNVPNVSCRRIVTNPRGLVIRQYNTQHTPASQVLDMYILVSFVI